MLLKILKIRIDELATDLVVSIIGFVIGILLTGILYMDATEETVIPLGTIMTIVSVIMVAIFMGIGNLPHLFRLEIGFGVSRKKFFIYDVLVSVILNTIVAVVIIVLNVVEEILIRNIYSGKNVVEIPLIQYIPWILLTVICVAMLRELLGAIYLKYGQKAIMLVWFAFIFCCLVPQRFAQYAANQKSGFLAELYKAIADWFLNLGMEIYGIMGVVFAVAACGISWLLIRKQAVQG